MAGDRRDREQLQPRDRPWAWLARRPLLLCSIALVVGVALADLVPHRPAVAAGLGLLALVSCAVCWVTRRRLADAALVTAALATGAAWYTVRLWPSHSDLSRLAPARPAAITAQVLRSARAGGTTICRARDLRPSQGAPATAVSGLFCLRSSPSEALRVGQVILLEQPVLRPWRPRTNPHQRTRGEYWQRRRVWCYARASRVTVLQAERRPALADLAAGVRDHLDRHLALAMPGSDAPVYADLVGAILYGSSLVDLPRDIVELYRRTGTIHVLVVSGSQVTLLVLVLVYITGGHRRSARLLHLVLVIPAAFLYAVLCGREPSILRATALAIVLVSGLYAGRPYDVPTALAFVAALLVLVEPGDLFSPSLQLTFAACLGVIGACGLLRAPAESATVIAPGRFLRGFALVLAGTAGAWVMTTPILAYHFGAVAITGNLANALVVPLASLVLLFGLPAVLLSLLSPLATAGPLWICRLALDLSLAVNQRCAAFPAAFAESLHASPLLIAGWYATVLIAYLLARHAGGAARLLSLLGGLLALGILLVLMATPLRPTHVTVTWLDVGEGVATVIETPEGHVALFDAGSRDPDLRGARAAEDVLLPYLRSRGCRRLSAAVVSHADVDHFNALPRLAEYLPVDCLVVPPWGEGEEYANLLADLRRRGAAMQVARAGAVLELGPAKLLFLHPQQYSTAEGPGRDNDQCLVAMVEAAGRRVLLTADVETGGQREVLRCMGAGGLRTDVLQVPHHGRKSAFLPDFLDAAAPALAVVPNGPEYVGGSLDPRLADHFCARGAALLPTSRFGAVTARLSEKGVTWRAFLPGLRSDPLPSPDDRSVD